MATLLLVIYIAYIGLGIPDSLFGAAWPAIYPTWSLPVSFGGLISFFCSVCTFLSSLFSGKLLSRFGTFRVTAFSAALTALALLFQALSENFLAFLLLCIPLGLGAGAIDTGLNGYVALHYNARQMNFLHCFYGVGVSLSPMLVGLILPAGEGFRPAFFAIALLQGIIAFITFVSAPLWRRAEEKEAEEEEQKAPSFKKLLHLSGIAGMWLSFLSSCAIEFSAGSWGATFLVLSRGMDAALAAKTVTLYYAGIALGRFFAGLVCSRIPSRALVYSGAAIVALALVFLSVPSGLFAALGLFLVGMGNGPIYPNLMHLVPSLFPRRYCGSIMGTLLAAACVGISFAPPLLGVLFASFGAEIFVCFLVFLLIVFFVSLFLSPLGKKFGKDCT